LRRWNLDAKVDAGDAPGVTTSEREEIRKLKRENAELRRANVILRTASACFAAEIDPRRDEPIHRYLPGSFRGRAHLSHACCDSRWVYHVPRLSGRQVPPEVGSGGPRRDARQRDPAPARRELRGLWDPQDARPAQAQRLGGRSGPDRPVDAHRRCSWRHQGPQDLHHQEGCASAAAG
jgi:hypothetical protein